MLVKDAGEFGLIGRIARMLPAAAPRVVAGVGDDVAVLDFSGPDYLLATCDVQAEGVHFLSERITPYQLGRKTASVNISDIAAAGGAPLWALVSLSLPAETAVDFVEELYRGMIDELEPAGAAIAGGNCSRLDSGVLIDFTLLGKVAPDHLMLRRGARPGDALMLTGHPGESRAGLELLTNPGLAVAKGARETVLARHLTPRARLAEGRALARSGFVRAMIDVSDGLLADLGHICGASGVGAQIDAADLPVSFAALEVAKAAGKELLDWMLSGGEDYELLFAADPSAVSRVQKLVLDVSGAPCTQIGRITAESGIIKVVARDGGERTTRADGQGWDHFSSQK